ncbi:MAG: hypothetical protein K2N24_02950 [Lachnospiraceae bacterium]|nr:hypothetical protein [Lachnospiraceae bacterium]
MNEKKATLESQLYDAPCTIEDTEEMFWLRESDDYQSKISLNISPKTIAVIYWHTALLCPPYQEMKVLRMQ